MDSFAFHIYEQSQIGPIVKMLIPNFVGKFEAWLSSP